MKDITKYQGVFPAFYACYDAEGNISVEGVKALTRHLIAKGVKGVYVPIEQTVKSFGAIIDGEMDAYPEEAFYNVGTIDDVVRKAGSL